jgi:intracellular septation protein
MGAANLFVALSFPTDIWVNFKLFGTMGLMLLFILAQGVWLSRYIKEEEPGKAE